MKTLSRVAFLILALGFSHSLHANWYNHPICSNGTIIGWHTTYSDWNGTDFTKKYIPGATVPDANLRGIKQRCPLLSGNKRGASFAVYNGPNRSQIRGWINVLVSYHSNGTVKSCTTNFTSGSGSYQYPTRNW